MYSLGAVFSVCQDTCAWGAYYNALRLCDRLVYPRRLAVDGCRILRIGVFVAGAAQCILGIVPQSASLAHCVAALHFPAPCSVCVRPYAVFSKAFGGRCACCCAHADTQHNALHVSAGQVFSSALQVSKCGRALSRASACMHRAGAACMTRLCVCISDEDMHHAWLPHDLVLKNCLHSVL